MVLEKQGLFHEQQKYQKTLEFGETTQLCKIQNDHAMFGAKQYLHVDCTLSKMKHGYPNAFSANQTANFTKSSKLKCLNQEQTSKRANELSKLKSRALLSPLGTVFTTGMCGRSST